MNNHSYNQKSKNYSNQMSSMEQEHEMTPEQVMCTEDIYESIIISINRFIYVENPNGKEWLNQQKLNVLGQEHKKYPQDANFCFKLMFFMIGNLADCQHEVTGYKNKQKFIQFLKRYESFQSERLQEALIILIKVLHNDFDAYNQALKKVQSLTKSEPKQEQIQNIAQQYANQDYKVAQNLKSGHSTSYYLIGHQTLIEREGEILREPKIYEDDESSYQIAQKNKVTESQKSYFEDVNEELSKKSIETCELMKICKAKNIVWFSKEPAQQELFLMYGDLLLETNKFYNDVNYTIQICDFYLQKKRVVSVNYDKNFHLIELKSENLFAGSRNFKYLQERLSRTQIQKNYDLSQQLIVYEQKLGDITSQYNRFFEENNKEQVQQAQQDFFDQMRQELTQNIMNKDDDFYSYLFFSYIDKFDMGYPIQIQQGVNEATCALFGCGPDQLVELMSRYGFIEQILKRGFSKDMIDSEPFSHILMMQNLEYFVKLRNLFDQVVSFMTLDGIHLNMKMIVKQVTQIYNGVVISNFYYSQYIIEDKELERLLQIRLSGKNIYSSDNILDLLLNQNIYNVNANIFGYYISNDNNFKPPSIQDLNPDKTCKYKLIVLPSS